MSRLRLIFGCLFGLRLTICKIFWPIGSRLLSLALSRRAQQQCLDSPTFNLRNLFSLRIGYSLTSRCSCATRSDWLPAGSASIFVRLGPVRLLELPWRLIGVPL